MGDLRVDPDRVDHSPLDERLQCPHQVRQVDAVHRRAVADVLLQEGDRLLGEHRRQALDQVELGSDHPGRARWCCSNLRDDLLGRADLVGELTDLVTALGVDDDLDPRDLPAGGLDGLDGEPAVDRAVPAPQDHPGGLQLRLGEAAAGQVRVIDDAVLQRQPELAHRSVATQVLVGQEEHLSGALDPAGLLESPFQRGPRVGRRADRAAMPSGERLDRGRGVHVGDRDRLLGDPCIAQVVPTVIDLR